jgi:protein phosphatase
MTSSLGVPNVINVAALTHRGTVRPRNEDAVAIGNELLVGDMEAPREFLIAGLADVIMLADGMGGHAQGELASRAALTMLMSWPTGTDLVSWDEALQKANEGLYDLMAERPELRGSGTTIVGAAFSLSSLIVFNVGDSRAYRYDGSSLIKLSHDDVPPLKAEFGGKRVHHEITQSLGGRFVRTHIAPHLKAVPPLRTGECILLCSDGLTDMVSEDDLTHALASVETLVQRVRRLFDMAIRGGGRDNISVILAAA